MWEKEKISKSLSIGLVALVFIFLSLQFVFFVAKVIQIRKYNKELAAEQSVAGEKQFVAGGESSVARRESSEVGDKSSAASVAGGGIPASEFGQNRSRDEKKQPTATENRENQSRESASSVQSSSAGAVARAFSLEKLPPRPDRKPKPKVELNSADTSALLLLKGIGQHVANAIVYRRNALGGYVSLEQLRELNVNLNTKYPWDSIMQFLYVCPDSVHPILVNHCSLKQLTKHPYLTYPQAEAIYNLRRRKIRIHSWEEIKSLECMNDSDIIRLQPYLSFNIQD